MQPQADILYSRAMAHQAMQNTLAAVADVDVAIALQPTVAALRMRAALLRDVHPAQVRLTNKKQTPCVLLS